ncbi:hypothetical protein RJ640_018204 [Escallonia rubra]|uniref:SWIM-type domain-containing protein n=1 Tax=Escallonia rubra TaxID=112253 RepID=A0AA88R7R3_9ASTE|nr:hypothetical protein RJ640_018204 [Escallonia rubra]
MTHSGSTPMGSQSFQSIEEIDATEGLTDFDIPDTHVCDEPRVDDVYDLSQCDDEYALLNGFGTRKHNAHKIRATGAIFRRQFVCNKEGFKRVDDKKPNVNKKRRRDLRTGCEAMMQVTLSKKLGVWVVDKFQDVHNHPLTTIASKVIKHRSHSKYHRTNVCKSLVSELNHEGLKASQITRVVNVMKPSEEADVTPRQCSSIIRIERKNNTTNSRAILSSDHPIEARAGECYTRSVFEIFKKEWNASVSCLHITLSKEPDVTRYRVGLITIDKEKWQTVHYYSSKSVKVTCSCAKLETAGILCKHIIYILKKKKITDLPEYYILLRWTIHALYKVGDVGDRMDEIGGHSTEKGVSLLTLWSVRAKFSKVIDNGRNFPSEIHEIDAWLSSFLEKQAVRNNVEKLVGDKMVSQVGSSTCISQMESIHQISIRDPAAPVKTKGRPKVATRLKSSIELTKEEKKQRTCAYCHGKSHYRTGCAKRNCCASLAVGKVEFGSGVWSSYCTSGGGGGGVGGGTGGWLALGSGV